jgi:hypothetical protein
MQGALIRTETAVEYFKELVDAALQHQHVDAGELTSHYVVNLLADFVRPAASDPARPDEPLALRLARARARVGEAQRAELRAVGDTSLFLTGFFSDSFNRRAVDIDYYIALGGYAYGSLGRSALHFSEVFAELATKFVAFVDVLSEVSERTAVASNADLLRLYERWLRTRSQRDGDRLVGRGIVPNASIGQRFLQ